MVCNVRVRYVVVKSDEERYRCTEFLKVTVKLLTNVVVGENDHTFDYSGRCRTMGFSGLLRNGPIMN